MKNMISYIVAEQLLQDEWTANGKEDNKLVYFNICLLITSVN